MTTQDGDAVDPDPGPAQPLSGPGASTEPHADYYRQAAEHFAAPPNPTLSNAAMRPITGGTLLFDLRPWHALSSLAALCLLLALFASSTFSWILLALLCAGGGWYLKTHNVAWPPTVREALVRQRLAIPLSSLVAQQHSEFDQPDPPTPTQAQAQAQDVHPMEAIAPPPVSPPTPQLTYGTTSAGVPAPSTPEAGTAAGPVAALMALILGIYWLWETYDLWHTVSVFSNQSLPGTGGLRATLVVEALVSTATNLALIVGGVQLLNRNPRGRGWIVFGCLVVLADALATWVNIYGGFNPGLSAVPSVITPHLLASAVQTQDDLKVWVLLGTAVPLLTLILTWSAATRRWCGPTATSFRPGYAVVAASAAAGLVAVVALGSGHREASVVSTPTTVSTTTTTSVVADSTALAIKNASVGDCINRIAGATQNDGTSSVTVTSVSCGSPSATDVVTSVTDHTGACGREWVQTKAFGQPIVLCLRKM